MLNFKLKKFNHLVKTFGLALFCLCILFTTYSFVFFKFNNANDGSFLAYNFSSGVDDNANNKINYGNYSKEYLEYLSLSDEEKEKIGVIPRMYDVEFDSLYSSASYNLLQSSSYELPTQYSLYRTNTIYYNFSLENRNDANFAYLPINIGNQVNTEICWAFASLTAFETSLYKMDVVDVPSDPSQKLNFSELNLAYTSQILNHHLSTIGGGTFDLAYECLCYDGPVYEADGEKLLFSTNTSSPNYVNQILNSYLNDYYDDSLKANFSALETYAYPKRSSCKNQSQILDLRNSIKNHIYSFGAVTAVSYFNDDDWTTYYNKNAPSKYYYYAGGLRNHAITLVGWDDNFTVGTHVGAYIAQNSWGEDFGNEGLYYVLYDDCNVEENVCGFVRVGESLKSSIVYNNFEGTDHEKIYVEFEQITPEETYTYLESVKPPYDDWILANIYETSSTDGQFLSRIKIPTVILNDRSPSNFYVYVLNNLSSDDVDSFYEINTYLKNNYSLATRIKNINSLDSNEYLFTSSQNVFYTVELDLNNKIYLEGDYFAIIVKYVDSYIYLSDNLSCYDYYIPSNKRTFYSDDNGLNWNYFDYYVNKNNVDALGNVISTTTELIEENLPMIVETQYVLQDIVCSAEDVTKTYDGQDTQFDINVTSPNTGYTIYYSLTEDEDDFSQTLSVVDAGEYTVYYKITSNYYKTEYGSFNVKINKRDLRIIPKTQRMFYGDSDKKFDFSYSNNVAGEVPKFYGSLSRGVGIDVGEYTIVYIPAEFYLIDNLAKNFKASNYQIDFEENVKYYIDPRPVTITVNSVSKIYGELDPDIIDPNFSYSFYFNNIVDDDEPIVTGKLVRVPGEDVGEYAIVNDALFPLAFSDNGTFKTSNYTFSLEENTAFKINKKAIVVTPNSNQQKVFGEDDPIFTFSHYGEVNLEEASFGGRLTRQQGENVGTYEITFNEDEFYLVDNLDKNFKANNYEIIFVEGIFFTINYGSLTGLVFEDSSYTYDGLSHYLVATTSPFDANVTITYSLQEGEGYSSNLLSFKDAGKYIIFAKFEEDNYNQTISSAILTISKKDLIVTPIKNQSKVYDGNEIFDILFDYSGCAKGETPGFDGNLNCVSKNVGEYLITKGSLQLKNLENFNKENYNLVFDNSRNIKYSITKRLVAITPQEDQQKYFGNADGEFLYYNLNLVNGEHPNCVGALTREEGEDVGDYLILQGNFELTSSDTFDLNNYQIVFKNTVFYKIVKCSIIIKVDDVHCYYGQTPTFDCYLVNVLNGNFKGTLITQGDKNFVDNQELGISFNCQVAPTTKKNDANIDYQIYATANNSNYNVQIYPGTYFVEYKTYKVDFIVLGNIIKSVQVEHFGYVLDSEMPTETDVNIEGYDFLGWRIYSTNNSYKIFDNSLTFIEKDTEITAGMEETLYNLNFFTYSDQTSDSARKFTISDAILFDTPSKKGHTFIGWFDNESFSGSPVTNLPIGSIGNKNYYAKWQINYYSVNLNQTEQEKEQYTYVFDTDYIVDENVKAMFDSNFVFKIVLANKYSKSNIKVQYSLEDDEIKFELAKNEDGEYSVNNIESEINIYVTNLEVNTYTINFVVDRQIKKSLTMQHGQSLEESDYPVKLDYNRPNYNQTAPYWNKSEIESIEKDEDIVAIYVPNVYNITFVVDDGKTYETTVTYGENVSDDILKETYNLNMFEYFDYDANLFGIDKDTTINVKIKSNVYIVYIVLICIGVVLVLTIVALVLRKKSKNKLKWWAYVKNPNDNIKK